MSGWQRFWRTWVEVTWWMLASMYIMVFVLAVYVWDLRTELALLALVVPLGVTLWVERQNRKALRDQDAMLTEILRRLPEPETEHD